MTTVISFDSKKHSFFALLFIPFIVILPVASCFAQQTPGTVYLGGPVKVKMIDANFLFGDSHYNMYYSDWLVSFDPKTGEVEILDRIVAAPNKKSGEMDYTSLGFELSKDGKIAYYTAPHTKMNPDGISGDSEIHLVTYNIPLRQYTDHGPLELTDGRRPRYCQGLEVADNGNLYIVGWVYWG